MLGEPLTAGKITGLVLALAAVWLLLGGKPEKSAGRVSLERVLLPIGQMGFIVTALCGMLFLREAFTPRKLAGLVFAAGALVMLARG